MYDAITVGARCAGAATAMLLARAGLKVLMVDRATFPSEIPHGHFIHRHGPQRLARWGVLEDVVATGCPPVTSILTDFGDGPVSAGDLQVDGVPMGLGPRRSELDRVMVAAAVGAGAELREGCAVDGFLTEGDRVTGIRCRGSVSGRGISERARIVIGADGRNSALAKFVGAPVSEPAPTLTCWYWSYWSDVPQSGLEIYVRRDRVIFVFPTNDGLTGLFVGAPASELGAARGAIAGHVAEAIGRVEGLAERFEAGTRAERLYGASQLPNFIRGPQGPGWALVGDAGCHKDPFMALGLCDALRDAELLAGAIGSAAAGEAPEAEALAAYETQRNEATLGDYGMNMAMARFMPLPPERLALRAAVRARPEHAREFYLASQGMIDPRPFFDPANLTRIMEGAPAPV